MKKAPKDIKSKSVKELEKDVQNLRHEIAKSSLESNVTPVKDTNTIKKKRKELARLLTVLNGKKQESESK